jgi:hypothetical protein
MDDNELIGTADGIAPSALLSIREPTGLRTSAKVPSDEIRRNFIAVDVRIAQCLRTHLARK